MDFCIFHIAKKAPSGHNVRDRDRDRDRNIYRHKLYIYTFYICYPFSQNSKITYVIN
jgi:hypothetical protein